MIGEASVQETIRIDKWLWAARFFKTRSIAQDQIELGRVLVGGQRVKASRELKVGDRLEIHRGEDVYTVYVEALSPKRGPASEAQLLYRETPESMVERTEKAQLRKMAFEPAKTIEQGRPTKRDARKLRDWKHQGWE